MENRPPYEVLGLTGQEDQFRPTELRGDMTEGQPIFFGQDGKRFLSHSTPNGMNRLVEVPHDPVMEKRLALPFLVREFLDVSDLEASAGDGQSKAEYDLIRQNLLKEITKDQALIDQLGGFLMFRNGRAA